jgi:hypothetical protein
MDTGRYKYIPNISKQEIKTVTFKGRYWIITRIIMDVNHTRTSVMFNYTGYIRLNGKFLRFWRDGPFLKRLVTCDEKWIFYDNVIQ